MLFGKKSFVGGRECHGTDASAGAGDSGESRTGRPTELCDLFAASSQGFGPSPFRTQFYPLGLVPRPSRLLPASPLPWPRWLALAGGLIGSCAG